MLKDTRQLFALLAIGTLAGCEPVIPQSWLAQSQFQSRQLYNQNQMLAGELGQSQQMASQLTTENQSLQARTAELDRNLSVANERLTNLTQERSKLHDQYRNLLTSLPAPNSPLSGSINRRFEELCRRYPEFEFDPVTGVARFNGELLFATGSNQIRPDGLKVLQEFAHIMNDGDARQFHVLVVGHTDDQPIVQPQTRAQHETNWELSAHRATAVVRQLAKLGVADDRLGVAGYSMYQPATPNRDSTARQQNRRVEIFVLAPDAAIAGRDMTPRIKR